MLHLHLVRVTAFVDWNSQIHNAKPPRNGPRSIAKRTLDHVGRIIGRTLSRIDPNAAFDVSLRIYHGWHKGFEPTANRRALVTVAAESDFGSLSRVAKVLIRREIEYGDRLLTALDGRLHRRLGIHLPSTLRPSSRAGSSPIELEEKMVDTAIATDVVDLAYREPGRWIIVLGDDDDLVPPLYTAEAVRGTRAGRAFLVSGRSPGQFLKLDGILAGS